MSTTYRSPGYYEAERIRLRKEIEEAQSIADIPKEQLIFTGGIATTVYELAKEYRKGNIDKILKESFTQTETIADPLAGLSGGPPAGSTIEKDFTYKKYDEPVKEGVKDFFIDPDPVMTDEYYGYLTENAVGVTDLDALNQTSRDFLTAWDTNHASYNTTLESFNTRTSTITENINILDPADYPNLDIGGLTVDDIKANVGTSNELGSLIVSQDDLLTTSTVANAPFSGQSSIGTINSGLIENAGFSLSAEDIMTTEGPSGFGDFTTTIDNTLVSGVAQGTAPNPLPSGFLPGGKKPDLGVVNLGVGMFKGESAKFTNALNLQNPGKWNIKGQWDLPRNINTLAAKILPGDISGNPFTMIPGGKPSNFKVDLPFVNEERIGEIYNYLTKGKKVGETSGAFVGTAADMAAKTGAQKLSEMMGKVSKPLLVVGGVMAAAQLASDDPRTRMKGAKNAVTTAAAAWALYSPEPISKTIAGILTVGSLLFDVLGLANKKRSYASF